MDESGQDSKEKNTEREAKPEAAVFPKKKARGPWLWVGLGCGTMFVLAIIAVVLFVTLIIKVTAGPVDVADAQLKALKQGEIRKAYNYGSLDFKNSVSFDRYKEFIDANPALRNNSTSTFTNRHIENNIATISGTLTSTSGAVTPIEYNFVKEKGKWKILFLNVNERIKKGPDKSD